MNSAEIIAALDLPASARVEQRVPKKLLLENGAPTGRDKRLISEGIEELFWIAALKPTTIGVPIYRDAVREYVEISVLRLTLRPPSRALRLVELVHRAVPYPVLLVVEQAEGPSVAVVHKRWSEGDAQKTVLDGEVVETSCDETTSPASWAAYVAALALTQQPRANLYALYQGFLDAGIALQAARRTRTYALAKTPEEAAARRAALGECARLDGELARVRTAAEKETQLARQVELNLEFKRLEAAQAKERLKL
jgi:hypothetical protein